MNAPDPAADAGGLDRRVLVVFPGLMLAMLLAALDQTIVATSLPTIAGELGGLARLPWVATAYLVASCIAAPVNGRLGDLFGRKRLFQAAIVIFVAGSALCGAAPSIETLIAARVLQGIGAGGLLVNCQAIIGDLVPPAERGRYQGFIQAVFAFATLVGPLVGGVVTEYLSWRWAFYINLPVGALALVVVTVWLHLPPATPQRRGVDLWGSVLLAAGVITFFLVAGADDLAHRWSSGPVLALAGATVVLAGVFVLVERRVAAPLVPLRLFRNSVFRVSAPLTFVAGFATLGVTTFAPLYQQLVLRESPTASGLRLAPLMISMLVVSIWAGRAIARRGRYRVFPRVGTVLVAAGMLLTAAQDVGTPYWFQLLAVVTLGSGIGLINSVLVLAAQNAVGPGDIGVATSTNTFARMVGSATGVAVFGAVFTAGLGDAPVGPSTGGEGVTVGAAVLPTEIAAALSPAFLVGLAAAVVGVGLAFMLRDVPLRRREARTTGDPAP